MFYVGQKVVCVDADSHYGYVIRGLEQNKIYTVRWVGDFTHPEFGAAACLRLNETIRHCEHYLIEDLPSRAVRFRPLVERKTDISVFTALLNPAKQDA